jgi:malonyl-CoA/methylmalonyl-CoA synthetase
MIFLPKFDPEAPDHQAARATVFMGVPTLYVRLLAEPGLTREPARTCGCSFPARRRC